jgi:hypothetical protein
MLRNLCKIICAVLFIATICAAQEKAPCPVKLGEPKWESAYGWVRFSVPVENVGSKPIRSIKVEIILIDALREVEYDRLKVIQDNFALFKPGVRSLLEATKLPAYLDIGESSKVWENFEYPKIPGHIKPELRVHTVTFTDSTVWITTEDK